MFPRLAFGEIRVGQIIAGNIFYRGPFDVCAAETGAFRVQGFKSQRIGVVGAVAITHLQPTFHVLPERKRPIFHNSGVLYARARVGLYEFEMITPLSFRQGKSIFNADGDSLMENGFARRCL